MKVGLCCIGKMENDYIREFVEYYKKLGVDHIFLYDNNDDITDKNYTTIVRGDIKEEHFEDVIGDYIDSKFVEVINYRNRKICQLDAYQDCYCKHRIDYDWIMFFDCDEFLTINEKEHESLKSFLNLPRFSNFQIIHVNMCIYDDNNLLAPDGRGVLERFTHRAEGEYASFNDGVKSIVRGGLEDIQWKSTPHTPISPYAACNGLGEKVNGNYPLYKPNTDGAYLKHFKCKTITEYIINKMGKGSYPDQSDASAMATLTIEDFFKHNVRTKEKEETAQKLVKELKMEKHLYIEAHIICYNEIKLAPFAMQYWKRNFNHIYIYDNGSTDGTIELLKTMPNVTVYRFNSNNEFNDFINIKIKNNCWKHSQADFVVVSDFDEFIYAKDLKKELQYMKENKFTIARLNGYDMVCDEFPTYDENKLTIETIQYGSLNEMMCKPILFNPKAISSLNLCCGAHFCNPSGEVKWYDGNKIFLLHHKFLSLEYMADRYEYLQKRLSKMNIKASMGMQYFWDEEKKKKEFEFAKKTSINVWEYSNSEIKKSSSHICVSTINGDITHMMYQMINGMAYAEVNNKDFYAYAKSEEDMKTFNLYRPTIFKKIRCVDNIKMLPPRKYMRATIMTEEPLVIDANIFLTDNEEIVRYNLKNLCDRLNITDDLLNKVKDTYNDVDFDNTVAVYLNNQELPKNVKEIINDEKRAYHLLIISNDMEYQEKYFKKLKNCYFANKEVDDYPKPLVNFLLMILSRRIDVGEYAITALASYIQYKRELND